MSKNALTHRQREALQMAAGGYNLRQVASIMGIAYQTARNHMTAVHRVYQTKGNRTAAVMEGLRRGDVDMVVTWCNILTLKKPAV